MAEDRDFFFRRSRRLAQYQDYPRRTTPLEAAVDVPRASTWPTIARGAAWAAMAAYLLSFGVFQFTEEVPPDPPKGHRMEWRVPDAPRAPAAVYQYRSWQPEVAADPQNHAARFLDRAPGPQRATFTAYAYTSFGAEPVAAVQDPVFAGQFPTQAPGPQRAPATAYVYTSFGAEPVVAVQDPVFVGQFPPQAPGPQRASPEAYAYRSEALEVPGEPQAHGQWPERAPTALRAPPLNYAYQSWAPELPPVVGDAPGPGAFALPRVPLVQTIAYAYRSWQPEGQPEVLPEEFSGGWKIVSWTELVEGRPHRRVRAVVPDSLATPTLADEEAVLQHPSPVGRAMDIDQAIQERLLLVRQALAAAAVQQAEDEAMQAILITLLLADEG